MRFGICSKSKVFITKIQEFLKSNGITSYIHISNRTSGEFYYVDVYKDNDLFKLSELMYDDAHIYLMRKYEKRHLYEETHKEKFLKFKEGVASPNPEPSSLNTCECI